MRLSTRGFTRIAATTTAAAAAVVVGSAAPAWADGAMAYGQGGLGRGYFEDYGDYFHIMDTKGDGHSAVIQWKASGGREGDEWDKNGANNGWTVINRNLPEEDTLRYRVCWGEWGSQYIHFPSCSDWVTTSVGG